jgi:hypothetical protein
MTKLARLEAKVVSAAHGSVVSVISELIAS